MLRAPANCFSFSRPSLSSYFHSIHSLFSTCSLPKYWSLLIPLQPLNRSAADIPDGVSACLHHILRSTYTLSNSRWPPSSTNHSASLSKPSPTPTMSTASQSATLWESASPRRSAQSWPWHLISFRQDRVATRASSWKEHSRWRQARACLRGEETSSARSACEKRK